MILRAVRKRNRLAVSFAEIIIAVAMMGVAALPIFGHLQQRQLLLKIQRLLVLRNQIQ